MNSYALTGIAIGAGIFAVIAGYYVINEVGLSDSSGEAIVVDKHYTPSGTSYRTTVVNNQTIVQPQATGDIYAVVYEIDGQQLLGTHDEALYEKLQIGDSVIVTFKTTRITQQKRVIDVQ